MDQIFEEYIEMDQSACSLTFVSRTWWSLALANSWLWRYILVMEESTLVAAESCKEWHLIGLSAGIRSQGKTQVCAGNDDFTAAVDRSGSVPIHITYRGSDEILMKQILTSPISSRVAVLDINNWRYNLRPIMAQITLGPFTQLTQLRSKMIYDIKYEEFIRAVQHSAPLLKTLEFYALTDALLTLPIWKKLRTLKFDQMLTEPRAFDSMLNSCHQLVQLSIVYMWPTGGTSLDPGALTNLEIAKFRCDFQALSTLELVNLRSLTITETLEYGLSWQRIHLPRLAMLRITLRNSVQAFKYLDAPLLQDLHITCQYYFNVPNSELLEIFSSLSFPRLTHLYVKAHWDRSVFSIIMNAIPNVKKINFICEGCHDWLVWESWKSVFDKLLPVAGRQPFCPKLESCTIADEYHPVCLRRSWLDYSIKAIQTYRKEHAMPKPRFEIYNRWNTLYPVERIEYN